MSDIEKSPVTVQNAANKIMSMMGEPPVDGEPSQDATHPEQVAEPGLEAEQQVEQHIEEPEAAEEPTEENQDVVTNFNELADHLGVEESFLESLIVPTKVNGEERQATIKDLIATFQKGSSADLKLMELADQRKQFDAELSQTRESLQQEWGRIQALNEELQAMISGDEAKDLEALRHTDPAEYSARVADRQQRIQRAERIRQEMLQEHGKKINDNYERTVKVERQRLLSALPDWQDESTAKKEMTQVRDYVKSQGFKDEEIDGVQSNGVIVNPGLVDHRLIVLARKAMLYDQSKKGSEPKKAKLKALPKVGHGKRKTKDEVSQTQREEVRGRVRKTGTVKDAALAIAQMMER